MKYCAITFSPTGTTRSVVQAVANERFSEGIDLDVTLPEGRAQKPVIDAEAVLIVGAPVYSGRIPELFEDYLRALEVTGNRVVLLAVYGNRAYEDALIEMKDLFEEKGCQVIAAGAFIGEHSFSDKVAGGRPDREDLEKARAFAKAIRLERSAEESLEIAGNRPYRERKAAAPLGPLTSEACDQCGKCAQSCPVGAISVEDASKVDESACIRCCSCIRICPKDAKSYDARLDPIIAWLEENCSENRMEPEWFV